MTSVNSLTDKRGDRKCLPQDLSSFLYNEPIQKGKFFNRNFKPFNPSSRYGKRKITFSNRTISRSVVYVPSKVTDYPFEVKQLSTEIRNSGNENSAILDRKIYYYKELLRYYRDGSCFHDTGLRFCPKQYCSLMISHLKNIWNPNNKVEDMIDRIVFSHASNQVSPQYDYDPNTLRAPELSDPERLAWPVPGQKARHIFISDAPDVLMRPMCMGHYDACLFFAKAGYKLAEPRGYHGVRHDIDVDQRLVDFFEYAEIDPCGESLAKVITNHEYFKYTGVPLSKIDEYGLYIEDRFRSNQLLSNDDVGSEEPGDERSNSPELISCKADITNLLTDDILHDYKIGAFLPIKYYEDFKSRPVQPEDSIYNGKEFLRSRLMDEIVSAFVNQASIIQVPYGSKPGSNIVDEKVGDTITHVQHLSPSSCCAFESSCCDSGDVIINTSTSSDNRLQSNDYSEFVLYDDVQHGPVGSFRDYGTKSKIYGEKYRLNDDCVGDDTNDDYKVRSCTENSKSPGHERIYDIGKDTRLFPSDSSDGYVDYSQNKKLLQREYTSNNELDTNGGVNLLSDGSVSKQRGKMFGRSRTYQDSSFYDWEYNDYGAISFDQLNKDSKETYSNSFHDMRQQSGSNGGAVFEDSDFNPRDDYTSEYVPGCMELKGTASYRSGNFCSNRGVTADESSGEVAYRGDDIRINSVSNSVADDTAYSVRNLESKNRMSGAEIYYYATRWFKEVTESCNNERNVCKESETESASRDFRNVELLNITTSPFERDQRDCYGDQKDSKPQQNSVDGRFYHAIESPYRKENDVIEYDCNFQTDSGSATTYLQHTARISNYCDSDGKVSSYGVQRNATGTSTPVKNYGFKRSPMKSLSSEGLSKKTVDRYSRKVFVGGLPQDITEEQLYNIFGVHGELIIDWPYRSNSLSDQLPKGYVFLLFKDLGSIPKLLQSCTKSNGKNYFTVSSDRSESKQVQIRTWTFTDAHYECVSLKIENPDESWKDFTIFVGGIPRQTTAREVALAVEKDFGPVVEAHIDVDSEYKYPKGAASVQFLNKNAFFASLRNRYVTMKLGGTEKKLEIKPYYSDDKKCTHSELKGDTEKLRMNASGSIYFCASYSCLKFFCSGCWAHHFESHGGHVHFFLHSINNSKGYNRRYDEHSLRGDQVVQHSSFDGCNQDRRGEFYRQASMDLDIGQGLK